MLLYCSIFISNFTSMKFLILQESEKYLGNMLHVTDLKNAFENLYELTTNQIPENRK